MGPLRFQTNAGGFLGRISGSAALLVMDMTSRKKLVEGKRARPCDQSSARAPSMSECRQRGPQVDSTVRLQ